MAITTYAELQTAIAGRLKRGDLTAKIPEYIELVEARLKRDVENTKGLIRSTTTTTAGDSYIALPDGFYSMENIQINASTTNALDFMTSKKMDIMYGGLSSAKPKAYAIMGDQLQLAPIPDTAYTVEIAYYSTITPLSDSNTTNWFLTANPDVYLYGACFEGFSDLHDDKNEPKYFAKYAAGVKDINRADRLRRYGDQLQVQRG